MNLIVTADLHLTDRPQDAYRFDIFHWLADKAKLHNAPVAILGDLTDKKDHHSAKLVHKIVYGLEGLSQTAMVTILKGNHDYVDPNHPFFKFIGYVGRNIQFINLPCHHADSGIYCIPNCRSQEEFDAYCRNAFDGEGVFLHQCVTGAISDTGSRLTGFNTTVLESKQPRWCFSGDIHRPQTVGIVEYVGSPYYTRFAKPYTPRVLLLDTDTGKTKDLHFKAPYKITLTIDSPNEVPVCQILAGDHVKLVLCLDKEDTVNWPQYKKQILAICADMGLVVFDVRCDVQSPETVNKISVQTEQEVFDVFCTKENLPSQVKRAGMALMEGRNGEAVPDIRGMET